MTEHGMVIVGAGHAGARAAQVLRSSGWQRGITLVECEDEQPYERPPLSKAVLSGEKSFEQSPIFRDDFLTRNSIRHRRNTSVVAIDRKARSVALSDGGRLGYHRLLLATGAAPRPLDIPGTDLERVSFLRSGSDARNLAGWMTVGRKVVIIGGGLIGMEAAASAVLRGCTATVVEFGARIMMRAVAKEIAAAVHAVHERAGVDIRLGRSATAIVGDGDVSAVQLDDGTLLPCDVVLICIGIAPRTSLAQAAGLLVDNGIAVDKYLRTTDPDIYAAGDACAFEDEKSGRRVRLECWKNAEEQSSVAARNMLGGSEVYSATPWMWSDHYDKTIQVAGYPERAARAIERHCDDGSILLFHLSENGNVVGISGFGSVREVGRGVGAGQIMIQKILNPDPRLLQDQSVSLKSLVSAVAA